MDIFLILNIYLFVSYSFFIQFPSLILTSLLNSHFLSKDRKRSFSDETKFKSINKRPSKAVECSNVKSRVRISELMS